MRSHDLFVLKHGFNALANVLGPTGNVVIPKIAGNKLGDQSNMRCAGHPQQRESDNVSEC